jgi:hypothetical protein
VLPENIIDRGRFEKTKAFSKLSETLNKVERLRGVGDKKDSKTAH